MGFFFAFPSPFLLGEKMVVLKVSINYTTRLTQHNLLPVCTHSDNILTHYVCCAGIVHSRAPYTELPELHIPIPCSRKLLREKTFVNW